MRNPQWFAKPCLGLVGDAASTAFVEHQNRAYLWKISFMAEGGRLYWPLP